MDEPNLSQVSNDNQRFMRNTGRGEGLSASQALTTAREGRRVLDKINQNRVEAGEKPLELDKIGRRGGLSEKDLSFSEKKLIKKKNLGDYF